MEKKKRSTDQYNLNPKVTVIVQSFNSESSTYRIIKNLIQIKEIEEIILIVDGSIDKTIEKCIPLLEKKNHFILYCNDIFEIRAYNRAMRMAFGEYIVLLQDDDMPPIDGDWVREAVRIFDAHPEIGILGGRNGLWLNPIDPAEYTDGKFTFNAKTKLAETKGLLSYYVFNAFDLKVDYKLVMAVNRAPMWIRRDLLLKIGYLDESYAPLMCDDIEISLRAWQNNYKVAIYRNKIFERSEIGGSGIYSNYVSTQSQKNHKKVYETYNDLITSFKSRFNISKEFDPFLD